MNKLNANVSVKSFSKDVDNSNFIDQNLLALEQFIPQEFPAGEIDQLTHIFSCTIDQQINCVIKMKGHFKEDQMKRAIALTFFAEPVLGCRFVTTPEKAFWQRRNDLHEQVLCEFIDLENPDGEITNFINSPINPKVDLPIKIVFFRTSRNDIMCLKVSHEAMDGAAIKEYLFLLTSFYKKLTTNPTFLPKPNKNVNRSLKQIFGKLNFFKKLYVIFQLKIRKPTWSFPWKNIDAKTRNYSIVRFTEEQYRKIKAYSKTFKVTITDMIITAFHRAMHQITNVNDRKKMLSTMTVNLRSYLPNLPNPSLCNLTASAHPYVKHRPLETFKETLAKVRRSTCRRRRQGLGLEAALFVRLLFSTKFSKAKEILEKTIQDEIESKATFPVITNIGLVKGDEIDFDELSIEDIFIVTPFVKAPAFLMGAVTFNEKMLFSLAYFKESYEPDQINHFLELMKNELIIGTNI